MNKVEHINTTKAQTILMKNVPIGTFFYWNEMGDKLYLRTYAGIVCIDEPKSTWDSECMEMYGYRPVEVTVKVERFV